MLERQIKDSEDLEDQLVDILLPSMRKLLLTNYILRAEINADERNIFESICLKQT